MDKLPPDNISDKELLEKYYSTGKNVWLGKLLQPYTLMIFGVCMKYLKNEEDAKDGVQQVFEKAINELKKYKVDYFKSWLYMVTKNHCLMRLREKNIYFKEITENTENASSAEFNKAEALQKDNDLGLLQHNLSELNTEQQLCITLFYLQKKSYREISEETGFEILKVKSNIQNGKRNLRILMERSSKDE